MFIGGIVIYSAQAELERWGYPRTYSEEVEYDRAMQEARSIGSNRNPLPRNFSEEGARRLFFVLGHNGLEPFKTMDDAKEASASKLARWKSVASTPDAIDEFPVFAGADLLDNPPKEIVLGNGRYPFLTHVYETR